MAPNTPYHSTSTDHQFPLASDFNRLWLVAHEREDAMRLNQHEYTSEDAIGNLKGVLNAHAQQGLHVSPPTVNQMVGQRYEIRDANGWFATYWLSPQQIAADDGALTAVLTPVAGQHDFRDVR